MAKNPSSTSFNSTQNKTLTNKILAAGRVFHQSKKSITSGGTISVLTQSNTKAPDSASFMKLGEEIRQSKTPTNESAIFPPTGPL